MGTVGRVPKGVFQVFAAASNPLSRGAVVASFEVARAIPGTTAPISPHPLNPLRTRRSRLERIAEVLGLASDFAIEELHHAHGI